MTTALVQGSDAWHAERAERLTGSRFAAAMGISPYQSRQALWRDYMGLEPPFEGNDATEWGSAREPDAIFAYECETGALVQSTGLHVYRDDWIAVSPDGLVGEGCIEAKCPYSGRIHEEVPAHYMPQVQGVVEVLDRPWCDFVSTLFAWDGAGFYVTEQRILRVHRSAEYWRWMRPLLDEFWECVAERREPKRRKKPVFGGEINVERIR